MRSKTDSSSGGCRRSRIHGDAGFAAASLLAVVSMVAVLSALIAFLTTGDHGGDAVADPAAPAAPSTAPPPSRPEPQQQITSSPQFPANQPASIQAPEQPASQPQPQQTPTQQPSNHGTDLHPQVTRDAYVEVYNNSSIEGLAARTTAALQAVGWEVVGTDDWYGDIPSNTVYYPPELQSQADLLARDLGIARTHPAVSPMRFDRLTVILTGSL
jgi:LytR cell envelope-related transcriptional attenuator